MPIESVVNVSEGRDPSVIDRLAEVCRGHLLDVHVDPDHHRSVFSLARSEPARLLTDVALTLVDLRRHRGAHPRLGAVDVVPFVPIAIDGPSSDMDDALRARDEFAAWIVDTHGVPVFLYGPDRRTLPEIRRHAWHELRPDLGPAEPHVTAGATCVGAREPLVAYNVWLQPGTPVAVARRIADEVRGDGIRALGIPVGEAVQVSMNLVDPARVGPSEAFDRVARRAAQVGATVWRAELVGLVPESTLARVSPERWAPLDLGEDRTVEARWRALGDPS